MLLQAKTKEPSKDSEHDAAKGSGNESSDEGEPAPPGEDGGVNLENHDRNYELEKNQGIFTITISLELAPLGLVYF